MKTKILGFAKKKNSAMDSNDVHPSWYTNAPAAPIVRSSKDRSGSISSDEDDSLLKELNKALEVEDECDTDTMEIIPKTNAETNDSVLANSNR